MGTLTNPSLQVWYSSNNGTLVLLGIYPFVNDLTTVNFVFGTPYLLIVTATQGSWTQQSYVPAYGDTMLQVVVDYLPLTTNYTSPILWTASQSNGVLNVTGTLPVSNTVTINIYNQSLVLVNTQIESNVLGFTYLYTTPSNQTYTVQVNVGTYSETQAVAPSTSNTKLAFPLLNDLNGQIFCGALVIGISFLFTPRHKGMGAVVTTALAALFVYLGWWGISTVVVSAFLVLAVLYAATQRGETE
jgi:hypothetical protein